MNMPQAIEQLIEKIKHLPAERIVEVEDFVDFLHQRDRDTYLRKDFMQASQAAFSKVWINEDDAAYDAL